MQSTSTDTDVDSPMLPQLFFQPRLPNQESHLPVESEAGGVVGSSGGKNRRSQSLSLVIVLRSARDAL